MLKAPSRFAPARRQDRLSELAKNTSARLSAAGPQIDQSVKRVKGNFGFCSAAVRNSRQMEFGTVILLIVLVVLPIAAVLFAGSFGLLEQLGRGGLSTEDRIPMPAPPPGSAAAKAEREAEIRQLVQARSDRLVARGQAPLEIETEVARLLDASEPRPNQGDQELREEIRQLVLARNERRIARGEPPLDVEAEIDRQLESL
jgi:hypothetical protein